MKGFGWNSLSIGNARSFFRRNRYALLPNFLDPSTAREWADVAKGLLTRHGVHVERRLEGKKLSYTVLTGETMRQRASEMYRFYRSLAMRRIIQSITGAKRIYNSQQLRSSININYLHTPSHVYRWHFEAEPYTAIVFLTTLEAADGGALRVKPAAKANGGRMIAIRPEAGSMAIIDDTIAHSVASLRRHCDRITLIMVYPERLDRSRPEDLDDYLYDSNIHDKEIGRDPNLPRN